MIPLTKEENKIHREQKVCYILNVFPVSIKNEPGSGESIRYKMNFIDSFIFI